MAIGRRGVWNGQFDLSGDLINLGMEVFQNQMKHLNFLLPAVTGIPALIAVIVLIVCALIAVNMILLLVRGVGGDLRGNYLSWFRRMSLDV